jgi:hypothetical protein
MERCGVDRDSLVGSQGIDTNKLAPGTRLKIDTCNSTYNIKVKELDRITIQGGNKRGVTRFPEPVGAEIIGSVPYLSRGIPRLSYLGRGCCLVMKMDNGKDLQTSPVLELTVIAPDESWEYCLEWKKQTD